MSLTVVRCIVNYFAPLSLDINIARHHAMCLPATSNKGVFRCNSFCISLIFSLSLDLRDNSYRYSMHLDNTWTLIYRVEEIQPVTQVPHMIGLSPHATSETRLQTWTVPGHGSTVRGRCDKQKSFRIGRKFLSQSTGRGDSSATSIGYEG